MLQSVVLFSLVFVVVCLGAGLLVARIASAAIPRVLLVPVGLALVMVVSSLFTYLDATAELAAPAVAAIAVAGLILGRADLARPVRNARNAIWPVLAAIMPAAAIAAPVVLTGHSGFTGYGRIVDLAFQVDFASYLQHAGREAPSLVDSSYLETIAKMVAVRYPGGAQAALGTLASLSGGDPLWDWQSFLAGIGACLGLALFVALRTAIPSAPLRALAAGVAAQPTSLYAYALVAGIKELSAAALIALAAALLITHRPGNGTYRQTVPLSVVIAAGFAAINVGILPWLGVLAALAFAFDVTRRRAVRVRVLANWTFMSVLAAALTLPALLGSLTIASVAAAGGPGGLGNLAAPVPIASSAGIWLTTDYRFPLGVSGPKTATYVLVGVVVAFAALGFLRALVRRDWGLAALITAAVVAIAYIVWRAQPWSQFKAFTISAPFVLSIAFAGAAAVAGGPRRAPAGASGPRDARSLVSTAASLGALAAGAVIGLGVLAGNALTYHGTTLAPSAALRELEAIGHRYAGRGPALYPVFDEYGEYLLRDLKVDSIVDPVGGLGLRPNARPGLQYVRDPDEYDLGYLRRFRLLIVRHDPIGSRPPSDWRLIDRTRRFDVWQRTAAPTVVRHFPQRAAPKERTARFCATVLGALRHAGPAARMSYVRAPEVAQFVSAADAPAAWKREGPDFRAHGSGRLRGGLALPSTTRYTVWLRGSFGRAIDVSVDGRRLSTVRWQESYPGLYVPVADVSLKAGPHVVELLRGGGSLLPGTGNDVGSSNMLGTIGPLAFAPAAEPTVRTVDAAQAARVCRSPRPLDWIEIVRPRG